MNNILTLNNIILHSEVFYYDVCDLGIGIFAKKFIHQGEQLYRFSGQIINYQESISIPNKEECKALQIDYDKYLDLDIPGVLINHSCDPNCGIHDDFNLIALRDIQQDEQIMYDYSTTMDDGYFMECRCNSENCRKLVRDFKFLPVERQEYYLKNNIVMSYLRIK